MFGLLHTNEAEITSTTTIRDPPAVTRRGSNKRLTSRGEDKNKKKKKSKVSTTRTSQKQVRATQDTEISKRRRSTPLEKLNSPVTRSVTAKRQKVTQEWYESTPEEERHITRAEDALTRMIGTRTVDDDHAAARAKLVKLPSDVSSQGELA